MICVLCVACFGAVRGGHLRDHAVVCGDMEFYWAIRTARLHSLRSFHLRPIDVVVYHGP